MYVRTAAALLALSFAVVVPPPAGVGSAVLAQDADFKEGDSIDIFWGGKWWPGVVRKVGAKEGQAGKWFVHFDGYGDNWDMWKEAAELRRRAAAPAAPADPAKPAAPDAPAAAAAPAAPGNPVVGERCEASWNNSWYEIDILEVKDGKFLVHWRGYGKESDEWLPRDRIRRKGEDKEVLPRKGREGNGGGLPPAQMVGKAVEVYWHGSWWPAVVKETDGKRLRIRYDGPDQGTMEEWAVPERVRDVGGAARVKVSPADVPGRKGLDGFFWRSYSAGGAKQIEQYFRFFPDGRVYMGPGWNPDAIDAAAAQAADPSNCGAYGIEGGKLHLDFGGDAQEWKPLEFVQESADLLKLNGISTFRAERFPKGTRLEGTWISMNAASFGSGPLDSVNLANATRYVFRRDGTYEYRRSQTVGVKDGTHDSNLKGHDGRYELADNHLTMRHKDGEQTFMILPMGHDGARWDMLRISFDLVKKRE